LTACDLPRFLVAVDLGLGLVCDNSDRVWTGKILVPNGLECSVVTFSDLISVG